jgi:hypothetical protein
MGRMEGGQNKNTALPQGACLRILKRDFMDITELS